MKNIEKMELLLSNWKAAKDKAFKDDDILYEKYCQGIIFGINAALDFVNEPPNTRMHMDADPCCFCKDGKLKNTSCNFCDQCGMDLHQ